MSKGTSPTPKVLLREWLASRVPGDALSRPDSELAGLLGATPDKLAVALTLIGRRLGKAPLNLTPAEQAEAETARTGWKPSGWSLGGAGMVLALLTYADGAADFGATFKRISQYADLTQLVALYRGLPLYAASEELDWQIGEGLRTSIASVFAAIAHDSPLPAESFSEHRWNHMVLKALFIGSELRPIDGLDARRNAELAEILTDHVHERRAAGRAVDLQVWRCIAPYAEGERLDDLMPLVTSASAEERRAAALCLLESPDPRADELLVTLAAEVSEIRAGQVTWNDIAP